MDIKELCKQLNVNERAFLKVIKNKEFPFLTKIGQNYIVHEKAYKHWVEYGNTKINNNESENN